MAKTNKSKAKKINGRAIFFWSLTVVVSILLLTLSYTQNNQLYLANSQAAITGSMTFVPSADTYVRKSFPSKNYNTASTLNIEAGSSEKRALLNFNTTLLPADAIVQRIQLALYVTNSSIYGGTLYQVNGSWSGPTVTWNTAPAVGTKILDIPRVSSNNWVTVDLPLQFAASNKIYNWYIITTSTDAVYYSSKETANSPVLTIEYTQSGTGSTSPTIVPSTQPTATPTIIPPQPGDPIVVAAGDIACDPASSNFNGGAGTSSGCRMQSTANLVTAQNPSAVLALGDIQYYCGSYSAFMQSYDLSWGKFKNITYPAVGNHEYLTSGGSAPSTGCTTANADAAGYFTYFGAAAGQQGKGYYSVNVGAWRLIALNTNCSSAGGCGSTSPQYQWLENELKTNSNQCIMAYYHIPLFSSGGRASQNSKSLFKLLYDYNADLVLTGHDHTYERFAPQTPDGVRDDARGIRSFVVGTGGSNHTSLASTFPNSEVRNADTYGILKLTLHASSYDWEFVPETGKTFTDKGTTLCH